MKYKVGFPATEEWSMLLGWLMQHGINVNPRGMNTKEIINFTSSVDMRSPVVLMKDRKLSYNFMCAEAHMIITGSNKVEDIIKYAPSISKFSDSGVVFQGAYGPKVSEQMQYVVETLIDDPSSRQAIISIWREMPRKSKDIPCTLTMQFLLRRNKLDMVVNMRSSDAWLGWPYDVFTFSMIAWYVCLRICGAIGSGLTGTTPGTLHLNAGSQHLYEKNWKQAHSCLTAEDIPPASGVYGDILGLSFDTMNTSRDLVDALYHRMDAEIVLF